MNRDKTLAAEGPWPAPLHASLRYPLRGSALPTLVVLALLLLLGRLLPSLVSVFIWATAWVATWMYALACLRHSAEGWATPPEITLEGSNAAAFILFALQLGALWVTQAAWHRWGVEALAVPLVFAWILPGPTLALAFGDAWWSAFNPARWLRLQRAFGALWYLAVGLGLLQFGVWLGAAALPGGFVGRLLWLVVLVYCILLNFHVLGILAWRFHAALGMEPEADRIAAATGVGADDELLARARLLGAAGHAEEAAALLRQRLHDGWAPAPLHLAFRRLALATGAHKALFALSAATLNVLTEADDWPRALAVVRENRGVDPDWLPPDPQLTGALADRAVGMGMHRLGLALARGYVNRWQRHPDAPRYGLLAARLLAERLDRPAEAGVLASKLLIAFPDCAQRADISALLQTLKQVPPRR